MCAALDKGPPQRATGLVVKIEDFENLPDDIRLALAHTPASVRPALATLFALDQRLARIVGQTTEPMLGQMRLAWWREALEKPPETRPSGDAVLDAIGRYWRGREAGLSTLVDGWEHLLVGDEIDDNSIIKFAEGRAAPFSYFLPNSDVTEPYQRVNLRAQIWACADAASKVASGEERMRIIAIGKGLNPLPGRLPKDLKGLDILYALGRRSLENGGRPLMEGRAAALVALKAALLGP